MTFILLLIAYLIPALAGYLLIVLLDQKADGYIFFERVFLGYGLGTGLLAFWIFLAGLAHIPYSILTLSSLPVLSIILLCLILIRSKVTIFPLQLRTSKPANSVPHPFWYAVFIDILLLWLVLKIFFVFYQGLTLPIFSWDTWGNWSAGAKFFYFRNGLVLDPSDPHFFGRGYRTFLGHPLLSPLLQVWTAEWLGEFHEVLVKTWSPLYFASLLGVFFCAVRREASPLIALIATFMLSSAPLLAYHATDAYSDLPLGYYTFAACFCFWRFLKAGHRISLVLSGIFSGISVFTKNEGIFSSGAICMSLLLFLFTKSKEPKTVIAWYLFPLLLTAGPWIGFKAAYGLGYSHEISQEFVGLQVTFHSLFIMVKVLFIEANFNMVFPFLFLTVLLNRQALFRDDTRYLFLVFFLVFVGFFLVYIMSIREFMESLVNRMAVNRNILTYLPLAYFLAALTGHAQLRKVSSREKTIIWR